MTPEELRVRARQNLRSAEELVNDDPDNAAFLAGISAELALKARYCSEKGIHLPSSAKELNKHKLNSHKLDDLLKLSDSVYIKRNAMTGINWENVSAWDNLEKYRPIGHISSDEARVRLQHTKFLIDELEEYELIEVLRRVENRLSNDGVRTNLMALENDSPKRGRHSWEVHFSSQWLDEVNSRTTRKARLAEVFSQELPQDLRPMLSEFHIWGWGDAKCQTLASLSTIGSSTRIQNTIFSGYGGGHPGSDFRGVHAVTDTKIDKIVIKAAYVLVIHVPT